MGWRGLRRATKIGSLPLPTRPRPVTAASVAAGGRVPDFDRVLPSHSLDGGTVYLGMWVAVIAILVGLAVQPRGVEGTHESGAACLVVVGLSQGQPVPTPPMTVSSTLCVLPHNFEPLAQVPLTGFGPAATLPPYPAILAQAQSACASAFRDSFGSPAPGGPVPLVTGANEQDWARGDRFAWCAAAVPASPWLDHSIR